MTEIINILKGLPSTASGEAFDILLQRPGVKLERIVSGGQATPEGEWYDQAWDEWVLVVRGAARLLIEDAAEYELQPGDSLLLPAHCRHRVTWTDPQQPTVWLALHLGDVEK